MRARRLHAYRWAFVLIACAVAALVTVNGARFLTSDGATGLIGGVVLVLLAATPMLLRFRQDHLDAPALYALITVAFLGVASLFWLGTPANTGPGLTQVDIAAA